jgi:hypothetical protein
MVWRTGPVGNLHRAILRDGTLVAVAESTEEAAVIVRRMNEPVAKLVQEPNTKELRAMCDDSIAHSGITYPLAERIKRELL